jgi:hypothetical protein
MLLMEPLPELFTRSKILILDFAQITANIPDDENIQKFFDATSRQGINARLPQNRQTFNDRLIDHSGYRYLIGRYGEDRVAMLADTPAGKAGRTIHLAIDIFCQNLETVSAPCNGEIVVSSYESGFGEYGYYIIIKPDDGDYFLFLGHLAKDRRGLGRVSAGTVVGQLGDYIDNENGGWSRHLHLQVLKELPPKGTTPAGYSTKEDFDANAKRYPNPLDYFPQWRLR